MYNLSAYYLARTAADIPNELLNTVLFVVIAYWFGGLRHTAAGFFGLLFSLVLVVAVGESWGLLIGGVFMEAKTAQVWWGGLCHPWGYSSCHNLQVASSGLLDLTDGKE